MFNLDNLQTDQTISFVYARKTASGFAARVGRVVEVRPNHVLIEETLSPNTTQLRQFHKSAMLNCNILV